MTTTQLPPTGSAPTAVRARPVRPTTHLLPATRRLHFYAGLFIGPFLFVAALTGALYAVSPQLEQAVHAQALRVAPSIHLLPLSDQIRAAEQVVGRPAAAVRPAERNGATTRVMFTDPKLGKGERRGIFLDPATGRVVGDLTVYGTSGALPVRTWIDRLHRDLHLGEAGRWYSELAASWLWVVAAGGLVLWGARLRRTGRARSLVHRHRGGTGRRRLVSLHSGIGVWAAVGMIALSATGITWSAFAGERVGELRKAWGWTTPKLSTGLPGATPVAQDPAHADHADHADHAGHTGATGASGLDPVATSADAVMRVARRAGIDAPRIELTAPESAGSAWKVSELERTWPVQADSVAVDPRTMQVVDRVTMATAGIVPNLVTWGIAAHMGLLFGVVNQIVVGLLGLAIAVLVVLGYLMWWRRRPTRGDAWFPRAVPPAALSRMGPGWLALGVVALGALTWLLPLFGYPLVGFLVVDAIWQRRRRTSGRVA